MQVPSLVDLIGWGHGVLAHRGEVHEAPILRDHSGRVLAGPGVVTGEALSERQR